MIGTDAPSRWGRSALRWPNRGVKPVPERRTVPVPSASGTNASS